VAVPGGDHVSGNSARPPVIPVPWDQSRTTPSSAWPAGKSAAGQAGNRPSISRNLSITANPDWAGNWALAHFLDGIGAQGVSLPACRVRIGL
jgi:hypothetical protein